MYKLYSKIKVVKKILKAKNLEVFGGLGQKVMKAQQDLASVQVAFLVSHGDVACHVREKEC
jgi:hypothetical protein